MQRRLVGVLAVLALIEMTGCATLEPSSSLRRPAPPPEGWIADRPITLTGNCQLREEDGFREDAQLTVRANRVEALSWQLWVGDRGGCRFDLDAFRQTRSGPSLELVERDGGACRLLVWQTPERVTLAHSGCEARCTPGVYEEAWPVMFDPAHGGCATR